MSIQLSIWHLRNQLAVSDSFWVVWGSFGHFWAVNGGFKPSFGHRPAQNRFGQPKTEPWSLSRDIHYFHCHFSHVIIIVKEHYIIAIVNVRTSFSL